MSTSTRRTPSRTRSALLIVALVVSGCGSAAPAVTPAATGAATSTGTPATAGRASFPAPTDQGTVSPGSVEPQPPGSNRPATTPPPAQPPEPLPEPELETADEIVEALFQPDLADVAVVSMLDQLGIGLYRPDGSAIRTGTEALDGDFFLFEPEVRGLIHMLDAVDEEDAWIDFRDFHAALVGLGFPGSAEELADAYSESYFEAPDEPMSKFIQAVNVESQINRFTAWLLLVDGFVPPNGSNEATARVGGELARLTAQAGRRGWGTARQRVQTITQGVPLQVDPQIIAHLMAVVSGASLNLVPSEQVVHKGHGSGGEVSTITATLQAAASAFVSPITGQAVVPVSGTAQVAGIDVNWYPNSTALANGSAPSSSSPTDPQGRALLTYTAKPEEPRADRSGYLIVETGTIEAAVSGVDLITRLYAEPSLGALMPNIVRGSTNIDVEWHAPRLMHVEFTNTYNVTIQGLVGSMTGSGTDTYIGDLDEQEDGTWKGTVWGNAHGSQSGVAFNARRCGSSWNASQPLEVIGQPAPNSMTGDFVFTFIPVANPTGPTGRGRCPPTRHKQDGIYYAPFNDYAISQGAFGQGLNVILPQKPGGERDYPVPPMPPGSGFIVDANWHVKIEFLEPVP